MTAQRLGWLGIRTPEPAALADFLRVVLGLTVEPSEDPGTIVLRLQDGTAVELFGVDPDMRPHFRTGPVVGFHVEDFDRARARLVGSGTPLLGPPGSLDDGNRWQVFRGPDGNVYALTHEPSFGLGVNQPRDQEQWAAAQTETEKRESQGDGSLFPLEFYEDATIFARYQQARALPDDGNVTVEEPAVLEFLGDVTGYSILDLGCGDGRFGRYVLGRGATRYCGIDGSSRMLDLARRRLADSSIVEWRLADLETWAGSDTLFDVVVARMSLHYLENLESCLRAVKRSLKREGRFVLSVEHPVVTSNYNGDFVDEVPSDWVVDDYFMKGTRRCPWLGATVFKQHRTFSDYVDALGAGGFVLERLSEGEPDAARFKDANNYMSRRSVPMYAILLVRPSR